ncbi:MAG: primosomal protein N' [SAR202 cluster bacterium Io17-Chloro-G9]|nr:MAG: primosomal protein N' [SAR202 cluster bacterium Io17-Chloro-G9]
MRYAEVAVDAPVAHSRTFSYSIPSLLSLEPGQLVWVPFGRRVAQGVVVELASAPQVEVTRDILQPVEPSPLVATVGLELARWLSDYYLCSLYDAIALFLPPGFEAQVRSRLTAVPGNEDLLPSLKAQSRAAVENLAGRRALGEQEFVKLLGRGGEREVHRLVDKGLVRRQVDLPRPRIVPRYSCYLLPIGARDPGGAWPEPPDRFPNRQLGLLRAVRSQPGPFPMSLGNKEFGQGVADALVRKGLLAMEWLRDETSAASNAPEHGIAPSFTLTPEQAGAVSRIIEVVDDPSAKPRSFLLHGVTGSGKTEVYIQAIQHVVELGQQAIFLVPEISLTPQTLERLTSRFPGRVAIIHSRLTPRQRFDQWWRIREGGYDVVVGPRSALFAPLPSLGLVVIDEEHEWTYKQEEAQPLYHARSVALELSRLTGAVVLLGSATPDVETYHRSERGGHRLLELPSRVPAPDSRTAPMLAQVEICDMRQELREGNRSIFSRRLAQALRDCVKAGRQAILFLNRRGSAPIVQCRDCGFVASCPRCSVSMTYHGAPAERLFCHRCNRRSRLPRHCRQCGSERIRQLGIGTQRVVDEVAALIPGVSVERWDADATRSGVSSGEIMRRLQSGETQVLVGTQLVAKGLDVPNVTLVGVILADVGLYLPDFRSGERSFGLLCQVAGRAGRGAERGQVVIQTYSPDNLSILAAADQDYAAMYRQELQGRQQLGNPPFNELVHLVYHDVNDNFCQRQATAMARQLRQRVYAQGLTDVDIVGPAPGIPSRLRGRFRWHLVVRGRDLHRFLENLSFPRGCTVDVDPAHVM